jgi:hypothetical protein
MNGETVFRHACKLGLEIIVSKRKDSPYRSGRSPDCTFALADPVSPTEAGKIKAALQVWGCSGGL